MLNQLLTEIYIGFYADFSKTTKLNINKCTKNNSLIHENCFLQKYVSTVHKIYLTLFKKKFTIFNARDRQTIIETTKYHDNKIPKH